MNINSIKIAIQLFGIFGSIVTICLGIPQLIRLKKTKNTGKVSFTAFWVFYYGILAWLVLGVFTSSENSWYLFLSNFACVTITSFTVFYLYWYYEKLTKKMLIRAIVGISINQVISLIFLCLFFVTVYQKLKFGKFYPDNSIIPVLPGNAQLAFGLICPAFTSAAFFPGLIVSLIKKEEISLSPWMALVYMLNNTFWILYFSLNIVYSKFGVDQAALNSMPGFIGGLVWQLLALGMFAFQFGVTLHFDIKHKKQQKQAMVNVINQN
ncbi:hypothetical protein D9D13_00775 [Metamycoplasma hominis]|uniref:PQ-loop domain-containing transporter n=1 Tax=Metamycoplasma hominis TaxID=2098 RepID=UPI000EAFC330|nr:PQ-loop domain-containing transporter [Metamycoplasma hominis]AYK04500.1 hypothetical protein D9D13_00775 [Metamycoplasma hominis]